MRQVIDMKFETACKTAMEYFKKEYGDVGFSSIRDLGDKWLFDGANAERSVVYGKHGITIKKSSGKQELFYLPNEKNFQLLDKSTEMEIPENYRVRV